MMTLGSLFDGLGGWQIAACRAGIKPMWSSEIEKFPLKLTSIRFPQTKQLGDITKMSADKIKPVDIITMGSPCQDLSIAGKRKGLAGERSGLFVTAVELVHSMRKITNGKYPKYAVWENVTGAFSSNKGMDFKSVLEAFTKTSIPVPRHGKWAKSGMVRSRICTVIWRTLDAQYWGVPQRRRRIFLVADFTDGEGTEEILFKPEMLPGDTKQGKTEREGARPIPDGHTAKPILKPVFCVGNGQLAQLRKQDIVGALNCMHDQQIVAIYQKDEKVGALNTADYKLRRLTPLECERLQGLPDNWTLIDDKTCSDSARYKAIGNGMAQPCADFIMSRIAEHEESEAQ